VPSEDASKSIGVTGHHDGADGGVSKNGLSHSISEVTLRRDYRNLTSPLRSTCWWMLTLGSVSLDLVAISRISPFTPMSILHDVVSPRPCGCSYLVPPIPAMMGMTLVYLCSVSVSTHKARCTRDSIRSPRCR
jgi:hypothetical protein